MFIRIFPLLLLCAALIHGADRYWVGAGQLPLDQISTTTDVAYSLRRLTASYAGPAVQIRRSSDGLVSDIGFTLNGNLDVTALTTFVTTNDAFVTIWYDQSGHGANLTNATAAAQPRLVSAGVLEALASGKPAVRFIRASSTGLKTGVVTISAVNTVATVVQLTSTPATYDTVVVHENLRMHAVLGAGTNWGGYKSGDMPSGTTLAVGTPSVLTLSGDFGANTATYTTDGGSSVISQNEGAANDNKLRVGYDNVGGAAAASRCLDAIIPEVIVFSAILSPADQQRIESSQAACLNAQSNAWSSATGWSATSGGTGGATVPTATDNVFFDANGTSNCTVDVAANAVLLTMVSGYTGTLAFGSNSLTVAGNADLRSGGTFTGSTGGLVLSANSTLTPPATGTLPNLTVSGGTATLATNDLRLTGNLTISSGTVAANGKNIAIAGNWANSGGAGGYTASGGTVTLNGAGGSNQVISGNTTFGNLSATGAAARTVTFTAGTIQTVSGTMTLSGAAGQLLSLRSSASPATWTLTPNGTRACSFVDVKDGINTVGPAISPANSVDSGNTTLWFAAGSAARYWVGPATLWSDTANWSLTSGGAGGASVPGVANPVIFDAGGPGSCTIDVAGNAASLTMVSGYTGTLAFGSNSLTVAGNADLRSGGIFTGSTGGLVLSANSTLTPPATGTIPNLTVSGGTATLATNDLSVAGNLAISSGSLSASGRNISVAGNWDNTVGAGGFTAGSGTVTLNGAGGSNQVLSGNTTFGNLSATGAVARTVTFTAGTVQTVNGALTLSGAAAQLLSLRSSASPATWTLTPNGTRACSFVDVKDGINTVGPAISPASSTNSGNNTLWFSTVPVVTAGPSAQGIVDQPFSFTVTVSNSPVSYSATGLPPGLSINTVTGVISGTPTVTGISNVVVTVTNGLGSTDFALQIDIRTASTPTPAPIDHPFSDKQGDNSGCGVGGSALGVLLLCAFLVPRRRLFGDGK